MEHPAGRRAQGASLSYFIQDPGTGTLYRRGQLLGKGAFGRCYKFTDRSTGRVFAAKIVPRDRVSQLGRGKVEKEIELHSHLCHPHVVGFHRHFADQDNIYMILEYCSRKSLAHVLKARNSLTEPEVRYYLRQIIAGLRYLHRQGLIHRDLKLSNFFLTKNMQVKIGDLGLATREGQAGRRWGVVCGTPNYLAPEVVAKQGHSFQSDIWALGCIMYTALTGCAPFETTPRPEMYRCIREGRYPAPSHLSPSARKLIARLLAPNPSERPSLDEVLEHEFFTEGFTPDKLPCRACRSVPVLALPGRLSQLLQKAAQVLFGGCQEPRAGAERWCPGRPPPGGPQPVPHPAAHGQRPRAQPLRCRLLERGEGAGVRHPRAEQMPGEHAAGRAQPQAEPGAPRALGHQVGGLFPPVRLRLPALGRLHRRPAHRRHPPGLLPAAAAGLLLPGARGGRVLPPKRRARLPGRQDGHPALLLPVHAAAAAGGGERAGGSPQPHSPLSPVLHQVGQGAAHALQQWDAADQLLSGAHQAGAGLPGRRAPPDLPGPAARRGHLPAGRPGGGGLRAGPAGAPAVRPGPGPLPVAPPLPPSARPGRGTDGGG
ncbi:inactive serine/threonine-protein kinase PLK5 isoform X2 [Pelodiscus sinensis]|uniref:inactive serine/threonine-protein kinase PLK5 isoform X2 n=1 Tax=Pelodiscus sinensis TaxID=13735 RepID=UPI003F6BE1F9